MSTVIASDTGIIPIEQLLEELQPTSLIEVLRWRAAAHPSRLAFTFLHDAADASFADDPAPATGPLPAAPTARSAWVEETMTYGRLDLRARRWAAALRPLCAPGDRVLLLFPPSLDYITAFLGCLYAGLVAVPAYPPRRNRNLLRLQSVVSDSDARLALTSAGALARLAPLFSQNPYLRPLRWLTPEAAGVGSGEVDGGMGAGGRVGAADLAGGLDGLDALSLDGFDPDALPGADSGTFRPDPSSLAFLQYTSGSTAAPRGVMVTHASLLHNQEAIRRAFRQDERSVVVGWLPLYHDMGLIGQVLQPLYVGGHAALMSPMSFLRRPVRWLEAVTRFGATTSGGPNFAYELCARKVGEQEKAGLELSGWRVAFNGAEPVRAETLARFAREFAGCGFRAEALQPCYGLAEATLLVSGRPARVRRMGQRRLTEGDGAGCDEALQRDAQVISGEGLMRGGEVCGGELPGSELLGENGVRLLTVDAAALERHLVEPSRPGQPRRVLVGCGLGVEGQLLAVVEPGTRRACAPGRVGEVWVSGPSVAAGYWGGAGSEHFGAQLEACGAGAAQCSDGSEGGKSGRGEGAACENARDEGAAGSSACACAAAGAYLRTGDLGFLDRGELFVTGRLKDLLVLRGRNLYPQDVEATVEGCDEALRGGGCAAFGVESGGEERLVVACEVRGRVSAERAEELIGRVREAVMEAHEAAVAGVVLLRAGSLPKTTSGKVQRRACREGYEQRSLGAVAEWRERTEAVCVDGDVPAQGGEGAPAATETAVEAGGAGACGVSSGQGDLSERSETDTAAAAAVLGWLGARLPGLREGASMAGHGVDSLRAAELAQGLEAEFGARVGAEEVLGWESALEGARMVAGRIAAGVARASVGVGDDEAGGVGACEESADVSAKVVEAEDEDERGWGLSRGQQALWFLHELAPDSAAYHIISAMRIRSELDVPALRRSFQALVDRHPLLRATFKTVDGVPVQSIHGLTNVCFVETDASGLDEEALKERLRAESHRPFDLSEGPLFHLTLFRRAEDEHILLLVVHHIISDLWSLSVLMNELGVLYEAERSGKLASLPHLGMKYADYVRWQEGMLAGVDGERHLAYWREQLAGAPPVLELQTDRPRPQVQTYRGASQSIRLSAQELSELKALAHARGATLYMLLLAAWQVLLHRYTRQEEILVGSPTSGRGWAALSGLVGYFVNPVVLRAKFDEGLTFAEFLTQVKQTVLAAFKHQDYPFGVLTEHVQPERDPSYSPLFQVMFVLQKSHLQGEADFVPLVLGEEGGSINLGGLQLESMRLEQQVAQVDLTLMAAEATEGLTASLQYNTDLFDEATAARLLSHLRHLLQAVAADPAAPVSTLPLLGEAERRHLLYNFNDTALARDEAPAHMLFERLAAADPHAPAVDSDAARLTYGELNAAANRLARHLRGLGVGPESLVGIMLERSAEQIISLLAVLKAGGAYLPLDPSYPAERLRFMLEDSGAHVLVTDSETLARVPALRAAWGIEVEAANESVGASAVAALAVGVEPHAASPAAAPPRVLLLDRERASLNSLPGEDLPCVVTPENLAYIIYTSGSTGRPKGVMLRHAGLSNLCAAQARLFGLGRGHRVLQTASFSFDASVWESFMALAAGAELRLRAEEGAAGEGLRRELASVDAATVPPSALAGLGAEAGASPQVLVVAGESCPPELARRWSEGRRFFNAYGPTEVTVCATAYECGGEESWRVPVGRPLGNVRVYVAGRGAEPAPVGVAGELLVGGEGLARGYLGRPALTAEKFIPNPFSTEPGARLYRTGDLARWLSNGELEFLGRIDQQVKVRGYRIELGEIEAVLCEHPAVCEAVVVVKKGADDDARLVAYLVSAEGLSVPKSGEMRQYLRERLPEYMIPSAYAEIGAVPMTPNGKVDKKALSALDGEQTATGEQVAPRTPVEEMLAGIFAEVLGVAHVGVDDNFFELGGHSLLATRVMSKIREAFGVEVPLRALFESPTVEGLAVQVEEARSACEGIVAPPLGAVAREGRLPLSFAQQRLWFLDRLEPGMSLYNVPLAVRLTGQLDVEAFGRTLSEVVRRHEVLRTRFAEVDSGPVQIICEAEPVPLPLTDLTLLAEAERETAARRLAEAEAQKSFDLSTGPLLRAKLLRLAEEEHVVLLTMHHIVSDGWSLGLLIKDVATLYESFSKGEPSPLAELPIQYADYAAWQREWLQGEVLETQLSYWRRQLGGELPVLELPTDRPRPPVQTYRGARHTLALDREATQSLKGLSRREGCTLFMTLLAGFQALLARYTSQEEIVVGTPIAGRTRAELEPLVGFFVNTLALRTDLSGDPTFVELMKRVREVTLGAYAHQEVPFEKLVEELQPERDMSRSPLFQAMLILQNVPLETLELPGLRVSGMGGEVDTAKFDLTLSFVESGGSLRGTLEYNTDLFDSSTVARMARHFQILLESLAADAGQRVSLAPMLTAEEQEQVLRRWNETGKDYGAERCVHELFEEQAARTPEAVAVIFGEQQLTYAELNGRANQLAAHLRTLGVGLESRVGISVRRSLEMAVGVLGILKSGAAYLSLDPAYPRERLAFMLEDAGAGVLLTEESLAASLPESGARVVSLEADRERIAALSTENVSVGAVPGNLAYLIYTSGSTGRPKGVAMSHGALFNLLRWQLENSAFERLRTLQFASLSFDVSFQEIFSTWCAGATLVMLHEETRRDPSALWRLMREQSVERLFIPYVGLQQLAEAAEADDFAQAPLREVNTAGEQLKVTRHVAALFERLGDCALNNQYGPSETHVVTAYGLGGEPSDWPELPSIGRPIANTRVHVLSRSLQPAPAGAVGELYLGGANLARGYLNRPALTAARFVPDPFAAEPGARLYRTGDLARYLPDGNVEFLGRADEQVKIRGFRVELGEIEAVLCERPSVREAVVTVREGGAGEKRLIAYVLSEEGQELDTVSIRADLKERLPEYMIPAVFVPLTELPLTPSGKVDRRRLPTPGAGEGLEARAYVAPRTADEEQIAAMWREVLELKQVGVNDNFFELGGHSLLATRVISRVLETFKVSVTVRSLFERPTVAGLAEAVAVCREQQQGTEQPSIKRAEHDREEALLARLDEMSAEDIEALLSDMSSTK